MTTALKERWCAVFLLGLVACHDRDPAEVSASRAIIYGVVTDTAGNVPVTFQFVYEQTADSSCMGSAVFGDTSIYIGTGGHFRKEIQERGSCLRLVVRAPFPDHILADTLRRVPVRYQRGRVDSTRVDVRVHRADYLGPRIRAWLGEPPVIPIVVTMPDTVVRNVPFAVATSHYGSGSCTVLDGVDVSYTGNTVTLLPYVRNWVNKWCTLDGHLFMQSAAVIFADAGPATVRITGYVGAHDTTIVRDVFVR